MEKGHSRLTVTMTQDGASGTEQLQLQDKTAETVFADGDVSLLRDLSREQLQPVGFCIYCGSTVALSREHIVPYGLSGNLVLPKASCATCAAITQRFEQVALRGAMRPVRVHRELSSRSGHKDAPRTVAVRGVRDDEKIDLVVDSGSVPTLLPLPVFEVPKVLTGDTTTGIKVSGLHVSGFGAGLSDALRSLDLNALTMQMRFDGPYILSFARMIAKIGYSFAFSQGRVNQPGGSKVVGSIRGETDDVGSWVGTVTDPPVRYAGTLHRLSLVESAEGDSLTVLVQLFADSETPTYGVIIR